MPNRRTILTAAAFAAAFLPLLQGPALGAPKEIRIGYQKNGLLLIAKQRGLFEKRFADQGITIRWAEFSFGPPLLEALGTGSIDYGTTGDSPPIFAQAAGANLLYVAAQPAAGSGSAILLPKGSTIRSLADLKGKRVGFAKGSSSHNLTIAALEKADLTYSDVTPVYLPPADARAAFDRGSIDAWTIWDPYYAVAEQGDGVRILATGKGIAPQNSYLLANRDFTQRNPETVAAINEVLAEVARWAAENRDEVARVLAEATGIDRAIQTRAVARTEFAVTPVTEAIAAEQQSVADRFHALGLIPRPIAVRDIVWAWKPTS
ncbi:sulfonate ABC transporter substrate-binding protein [Arenibaculum pallidiluteum]|uniref:sulfonate ABC transporter substrate-binding protein n=1 Tax=Arenibaculum pallidiluteum TaxID=2812559 RepID=UPI001A974C85|nr:sulfonate ABC transporter substrate-binding protein [Arenibaculum pallidiluteum]